MQIDDQPIDDQPTWWGFEGDGQADLADIFRMIALGMDEGMPAPIAVVPRPWAVEMIIQVAPSHRDAWRAWWWRRRDAGPWAVTQRRRGRYIHRCSYGNWRGWRVVIRDVTKDGTDG